MSSILGTNVLAPVVPFDTTDSHASHEARYGKGGYRSVADLTERDAIPQLRREAGMLVLTLSDGKFWKLATDLAAWSEISLAGTQGPQGVAGATGPQGPAGTAASATTSASDLTSGTLPDARLSGNVVLTSDSRLSNARAPTSHSHAVADVTGLQTALDAKQAAGSYAAASHTHTAGQVSGLATVATSGAYADLSGKPSLFSGSYADLTNTPSTFTPAAHNQTWSTITATPTTLSGYGITDAVGSSDSRLTDSRTPASHVHGNLTNAGAIGSTSGQIVVTTASGVLTTAATIAAASQVSGLATVATSGLASDLSGTLADARLSATVTTTLTNARTPTAHASSHASGGSDAVTLAATQITSGTLADARLSSAIATYATLATVANQASATLDIFPRGEAGSAGIAQGAGTIYFTYFTPSVSFTASSITMVAGTTAAAGLTLARMGIYTMDETTATLVARTASDTTLFATVSTAYTRSLSTTGGYPATYTLNAGSRYAVAVICVGTTAPLFSGRVMNAGISALSPRVNSSLASQTDLVTSTTTFSGAQGQPWARLT